MDVTYDNSAQGEANGGVTSVSTSSFAVAGNTLLVWVITADGVPANLTSVKWGGSGGTNLTRISNYVTFAAYFRMSLWKLDSPTAQTSTVYCNFPTQWDARIMAISFNDVATVGTVAEAEDSNGSTTTINLSVASASGDMVVAAAGDGEDNASNLTISPTGSQTVRQSDSGSPNTYGATSLATLVASGSSTAMNFQTSAAMGGTDYGIAAIGVALKASGPAAGSLLVPNRYLTRLPHLRM